MTNEGREEKLTWTFEKDIHGTSYAFYENNDFRFKAALNDPQAFCDMLNEHKSLREQLAKERKFRKELVEHILKLKNIPNGHIEELIAKQTAYNEVLKLIEEM